MKIAVLNFSGNVGKTTITKNLLLPRLPDTPYLAIETINDNGAMEGDMKVKGKNYSVVLDELMLNDNLLVDMGSSNIEESLRTMQQQSNSHEEYDYFIVPVVPKVKQQIDTNSTILKLIEMGVKPSKIRLVFNMVEDLEDLEHEFADIIAQASLLKIRLPKTGIETNDAYSQLRTLNIGIEEILAQEGLREAVRQEKDPTEKRRLANLVGVQRLATTAKRNLDAVFKDLALS